MKKLILICFSIILFNSCVSTKTFHEVENRYANLKMDNKSITEKNKLLNKSNDSIVQLLSLKSSLYKLTSDSLEILKADLKSLKLNYASLESKSDSDIKSRIIENNNLIDSLSKVRYKLSTGLKRVLEL